MVFSLCACGQQAAPEQAEKPSEDVSDPEPELEVEGTDDPIADQIVLIFNSICMLKSNPDYSQFWYVITDLDHNDRLEVTAAVTEGTGNYTRALMYEVAEDMKSLVSIDLGLKEGEYLPEIIKSKTDVYVNEADGTWNYIYYDSTSIGGEGHTQTMEAVTLKDGKLNIEPLAYTDVENKDGKTAYIFTDVNGKALANDVEYLACAANRFPGITAKQATFDWFALSDIISTERVARSYSVFAGIEELSVDPIITPAPEYVPEPIPEPTPTPTPAAAPVVTKNPTSESVYAGGSAQFVARADNATSIRWKLNDQSGNVYDIASSPFAGQLGIAGASDSSLTLTNIPLGMDGYKVYAEFTGTSKVNSAMATITVTKAPSATVTASVGTGTVFGNLYNTVYLYSSNGAKIHYECIKQGDSGAYASGEIGNGGQINIMGIEGQNIKVEVYCSVIGSDKTCYFSFYVDLTPAPAPTEYDEVGYVVGDNYAEVFIQTNSGVHYIEKSACMFGGTGYYTKYDAATVTYRNGEPLICVINCTGEDVGQLG